MKLQRIEETPRKIQRFKDSERQRGEPTDIEDLLTPADVDHVAEIFNTPLTGAYNWNYRIQDDRIKKLYELGKELNWNAEMDIDWNRPWPEDGRYRSRLAVTHEPGGLRALRMALSDAIRSGNSGCIPECLEPVPVPARRAGCPAGRLPADLLRADLQRQAVRRLTDLSTRRVTSRCSTSTSRSASGMMYPINTSLKSILDKILTDPRWDLKFIGMQIIIEGLALSAFNTARETTPDEVLKDVIYLVVRDEARHVTFGVNYLEDYVKTLTEEEKNERAEFAYEACVVSRERLVSTDVFRYFGWDVEEARQRVMEGFVMSTFRDLLFQRVIPNLKRIGLLTEAVRPKFESLGILDFESLPDDGDIDWQALERPLDVTEAQSLEQKAFQEQMEKALETKHEHVEQVAEAS